jgi:amidase
MSPKSSNSESASEQPRGTSLPLSQTVLSAREKLREYRAGRLSPVTVLEEHLASIDARNASVFALRHVDAAGARAAAQRAAALLKDSKDAGGLATGRLQGIVYSAKDSLPVAGLPRSDGTLHRASSKEASDCTLVERMRSAGALCIGKANMAEYGKSYFTDNSAFGRTSNPYNLELSAGGSGGGDAAAVACNFCDLALGADAGGSIRVPANFNGVFGLFPSRGLLSGYGMPLPNAACAQLLRSYGPIARTLEDLRLAFEVLVGFDARDPYSIVSPNLEPRSGQRKKRIGYYSAINGVRADARVQAQLSQVVERCRQLGYECEEYCPAAVSACFEVFIILGGQAALLLEDLVATDSGNPRDFTLESPALKRLRSRIAERLPALTAETLLRAWFRIDQLRHEVSEVFTRFDALISPVCACLPPPHQTQLFEIDDQKLESQHVFQFASCANVLNLPAIAFPTGWSAEGLPLGLQLIGPRYAELDLFEMLNEWGYRRQPQVG